MEITMDIVKANARRGIDPVCVSHKHLVLVSALEDAIGTSIIREIVPVMGEPQSVRLLLTHYRPGLARTFPDHDNYRAAQELIKYRVDARYPEKSSRHAERAWKISSLLFQGHAAALATATWLEP